LYCIIAFHFHRFSVYAENFQSYVPLHLYVCMLMSGLRLSNLNKLLTYLLTNADNTPMNYFCERPVTTVISLVVISIASVIAFIALYAVNII